MANWGYSISKDNQVDYDKGSKEIYSRLNVSEPSAITCMACGSCASTCSVGVFSDTVNIRKLNLLVSRGQTQDLLPLLKKCVLCGKCSLVCPRGINTRNFIRSLKDILTNQKN